MTVTVEDTDLGWRKAIAAFGKGATVRCGIQGSDAVREHDDKSKATIVEIATVHEFGSSDGRVPQRSYLRSTFDEKQAELTNLMARLGKQIAVGKMEVKQAVQLLGLRFVDLTKAKIRSKIDPPLASSTIAGRLDKIWASAKTKKRQQRAGELQAQYDSTGTIDGAAVTPLIDTGRLIGSIRAVVRTGEKS